VVVVGLVDLLVQAQTTVDLLAGLGVVLLKAVVAALERLVKDLLAVTLLAAVLTAVLAVAVLLRLERVRLLLLVQMAAQG
jgi:hypothetical protein